MHRPDTKLSKEKSVNLRLGNEGFARFSGERIASTSSSKAIPSRQSLRERSSPLQRTQLTNNIAEVVPDHVIEVGDNTNPSSQRKTANLNIRRDSIDAALTKSVARILRRSMDSKVACAITGPMTLSWGTPLQRPLSGHDHFR